MTTYHEQRQHALANATREELRADIRALTERRDAVSRDILAHLTLHASHNRYSAVACMAEPHCTTVADWDRLRTEYQATIKELSALMWDKR